MKKRKGRYVALVRLIKVVTTENRRAASIKTLPKHKGRRLNKLACVLPVAMLTTGCGGSFLNMVHGSDHGYFEMRGDAEGIRAYSDHSVGLVTEGKTSPDVKGAFWQHREEQTRTKALKFRIKPKGAK